jgi:hypothetical protein
MARHMDSHDIALISDLLHGLVVQTYGQGNGAIHTFEMSNFVEVVVVTYKPDGTKDITFSTELYDNGVFKYSLGLELPLADPDFNIKFIEAMERYGRPYRIMTYVKQQPE